MKFLDPHLSEDLTGCPDYGPIALEAIREMHRQPPKALTDREEVLQADPPLSIMKQYHPRSKNPCERRPALARSLSEEECFSVVEYARKLGFTWLLTR